jgi:hypothetical protein
VTRPLAVARAARAHGLGPVLKIVVVDLAYRYGAVFNLRWRLRRASARRGLDRAANLP